MVGFTVEKQISTKLRYLWICLLGGLAGNLLSAVANPYSVGVGASGAIFSIVGALGIYYKLNFHRMGQNRYQFLVFFILLLGFSLLNGFIHDHVDGFAHLGGFIVGICCGCLFLRTTVDEDT